MKEKDYAISYVQEYYLISLNNKLLLSLRVIVKYFIFL